MKKLISIYKKYSQNKQVKIDFEQIKLYIIRKNLIMISNNIFKFNFDLIK